MGENFRLISGDIGDRLPISKERKGAIPSAGFAVQKPEVQAVGLRGDWWRNPDNGLEIAVGAVAFEIALDESDAAWRGTQLARTRRIPEIAEIVPRKRRIIVVAEILFNDVSLRHRQLEVSLIPPITLDQHRVSGDIGDRLPISKERKGAIPSAGFAVQKPEVQAVGLRGDWWRNPDNGLEIAVGAVAFEIALDESDAAWRGTRLARTRRIPEIAEIVPRKRRIIVVAEILFNDVSLRHQQLEVSLIPQLPWISTGSPVTLVTGCPSARSGKGPFHRLVLLSRNRKSKLSGCEAIGGETRTMASKLPWVPSPLKLLWMKVTLRGEGPNWPGRAGYPKSRR